MEFGHRFAGHLVDLFGISDPLAIQPRRELFALGQCGWLRARRIHHPLSLRSNVVLQVLHQLPRELLGVAEEFQQCAWLIHSAGPTSSASNRQRRIMHSTQQDPSEVA
ncbi:MAG: hypothetical protein FD138_2305 [Planctomycetota bacterium]|nr:MAG: hypothetical protein FD138_2305 [Planctomycetota bacterium]